MAAHLRTIRIPLCVTCRKPATVTLHNTFNEPLSEYCERHGDIALADYLRKYGKAS